MKSKGQIILIGLFVILSTIISTYAWNYLPTNNDSTLYLNGIDISPQPAIIPEPTLVLTRQWLPNDIFRLLIPIPFSVSKPSSNDSTQLILSDIRFLGVADDWKKAKLYGIAVPGTSPNPALSNFLSSDDAKVDLKTIADRAIKAKGSPDWLVVMSLTATWSPFHLVLVVDKAEIRKGANLATDPPQYVKDAFQNPSQLESLLDLDLSQITTPIDSANDLKLSIAVSFAPETITFALIPSETIASWQQPPPGVNGLTLDTSSAAADTSVIAQIPHSFINSVLSKLTAKGPVDVKVGSIKVKVSSPEVSTFTDTKECKNSCFRLSANINDSDGQKAIGAAFDWSGDDLAFQKAVVTKNFCPTNLKCQLLEGQAIGGALILTKKLTKPTARLLRPQEVRRIGLFALNGKRMAIDILLQNIKVTPNALSTSGFATLTGQ
jgi:hypothetical protein